ncbi:hypothetical protein AB4099_18975 [Bosea sp. 2KB_26]|uniref:hypothetical protein n=1 Tax=Bosea sp. 2KB_26 TaxID=3237475 RepID=UPI003F8EA388
MAEFTGTVTVACKLPHGLILQLQEPREVAEPTQASPDRKVTRYERVGKVVAIAGCALHMDRPSAKQVIGGFALTHGVDAAFFAKWLDQNKELPAVEGGFIFAAEKMGTLEGQIAKGEKRRTGMEPADPKALPAEFRQVETASVGA